MAVSKTTRDHEEIRAWAEARGAKPAEVASTDTGKGPGILRLEFPKAPKNNDSNLRELAWEEFFEKFDASDLELVLQDVTAEGAQSNFNRFIHPEHDEHSSRGGAKAGAKKAASKKATTTKSAGGAAAKKGAPAKKAAEPAAKKAATKTPARKAVAAKPAQTKVAAKKSASAKAPAKRAQAKKAPAKKAARR